MKTLNLGSVLRSLSKKRIYVSVAILAICVGLTAAASGQNSARPTPTPTGCGSDVTNLSLNVELGGYQILPDINDAYTTRKVKGDQITAMFQIGNCSQDFTLDLNFSRRYMDVIFPGDNRSFRAKFYIFDRVASVPMTETAGFLTSIFCTSGAGTPNGFVVPLNSDGTYQDNYAGCGSDAGGNFVRRNVGIRLDDGTNASYSLRFQNSPLEGSPNAAGTSYIKVYHPTATTWVLEPETPATGVRLLSQVPNGLYTMLFRFTLTRLP